ncbi:MAG: DUF3150 domain-containing protein, partial [Pseudomonadota bacterium]|nr:DUF3150 domain-containing protein [Pseudomonadota bacterium]
MSYQALTLAVQPLSRVVCIHLDVHIWSGRKKLRPEDLGRLSGTFPPPDFASLGSKKVCDPAALAVFHRLYRRAHRLCERVGIHFMKGYAIPETAIETVLLELDELHEAFKVCLDEFLLTYEQDIRSWASAHPGYEQAVLRVMDSPETVRARTWFAWQAFRIRCDSQEESALMHQGISQLAQGMAGQLFHEVSQAAKQLF